MNRNFRLFWNSAKTLFLVLLAVIVVLPTLAQDTTPPRLTSFTFAPMAVNTTTSPATVTVTEQLTDDLAGVSYSVAHFTSPSGNQTVACETGLISGTDLNGTWQCQMNVPAYSEAGTWTVAYLYLVDNTSNVRYYRTSDLQALGFPAQLEVTSNQDTTPPMLTRFTFAPMAVNTTTSPATVTVTEQLTDDLAGVSYSVAYFTSPSGNQTVACETGLISGTDLNGTWQCQMNVPAYSEAGTWTVAYLYLVDNTSNVRYYRTSDLQALGFPAQLEVTSNQDTTPPMLTSFTFAPMAVNTTTSPATVTVTEQLTDDLAGVSYSVAYFTSPSGNQTVACETGLISGTDLNGTWHCQMNVPAYSEAGTWTVAYLYLVDNTSNVRYYRTSDLQALGFPATLIVDADNIPPTTTANPSPGPNINGWNNTNVAVALNAIDNSGGSGVKQIQFALGGVQNTGWQTVAGNAASVTISAEGTTVLSYYATDNAGNQETAKRLTIRIDKTPPLISGMPAPGCTILPPNHKLVQIATVKAADALSGLAPGSFKVTATSNDPANGQIVITGGPSQFLVQLGANKDQVYTLTATASDLAGNVATSTATCTVPHDQGK